MQTINFTSWHTGEKIFFSFSSHELFNIERNENAGRHRHDSTQSIPEVSRSSENMTEKLLLVRRPTDALLLNAKSVDSPRFCETAPEV